MTKTRTPLPPCSHLLDFGHPLPPTNVQNFTSAPAHTSQSAPIKTHKKCYPDLNVPRLSRMQMVLTIKISIE